MTLPDSLIGWGILARRYTFLTQPSPPAVPSGRACQQLSIFWTKNAFWQDVNLRQTSQQDAFYNAWKAPKSVFGQGSASDPAWSSRRSPDSVVGWGGGNPFPIPHPSTLSASLAWHIGHFVRRCLRPQPLPTLARSHAFRIRAYQQLPIWINFTHHKSGSNEYKNKQTKYNKTNTIRVYQQKHNGQPCIKMCRQSELSTELYEAKICFSSG